MQGSEGWHALHSDSKRYADYVDHPAEWSHKLPAGMSHELGALAEPLSVGIQTCKRGKVCSCSAHAPSSMCSADLIHGMAMAAARTTNP